MAAWKISLGVALLAWGLLTLVGVAIAAVTVPIWVWAVVAIILGIIVIVDK